MGGELADGSYTYLLQKEKKCNGGHKSKSQDGWFFFNLIAINRHQEDRLLPSPTIDHQLDRWMENDDTGARARLARLAALALCSLCRDSHGAICGAIYLFWK